MSITEVDFYPPQPAPASNAIGSFEIGVSPIGTIPKFNWLTTVISQYANSPALLSLLASFSECVDQTANFDAFFDNIWNIDTAQGIGLDIWGRIVGVNRNLQVSNSTWFGFNQNSIGADTWGPGGESPWYTGEPVTSNYALTDSAYRQLILAKAAYNICDGSIPAINNLMMNLFGSSGVCYCTDLGGMAMTYTFLFAPNPVQSAIIYQSSVLPKPVGVSTSVIIL